jgi:hypothetical protein
MQGNTKINEEEATIEPELCKGNILSRETIFLLKITRN